MANAVLIDGGLQARLLPLAALVPDLASQVLDGDGIREISFGRAVPQREPSDGPGALVAEDGRLLAVAEGRAGQWHPVVVLEPAA